MASVVFASVSTLVFVSRKKRWCDMVVSATLATLTIVFSVELRIGICGNVGLWGH